MIFHVCILIFSFYNIAIEEAWVDIDVCVKSSEITVKNNITQQVRSLCDGQTFCSVPYIKGKYQYANVKYHCIGKNNYFFKGIERYIVFAFTKYMP
jgi:hypothetical protein